MNNSTTRPRIYLSSPHMGGEELMFIEEAFRTNWIAPLGANVDLFEQELASYCGTKGALALSSGTAAIHLALRLLGVGRGDVVFCSSLTFVASANPILYQGAEPVFIDSEPDSWNMSPVALRKALEASRELGKLPKAVIVVNLYGQSADYDAITNLCNDYEVPIIEDAAESLGATYKEKKSGSIGRFGIYSFNGNKIITTSGGGMLVSDDVEALDQARFYATQARDEAPHYQHSQLGYNYRLSNVLAGIGRGQLRVLDERVKARRQIFRRYQEALSHIRGLSFMPECEYGVSTRWLTALTVTPEVANINTIINGLAVENIEARPVWKPLHMQPLFSDNRYYKHGDESVTDQLFHNGICLPSGSNMTEDEQDKVINTILKLISNTSTI
ncbi:DegT/DnrJ/EryC1/StrS aminotransferase family protein [Paenibacillus sp. YYML68]|uniref:DegT/DnrJ/EryC1/StrS family aminotransferase n=1 Tax=Paenibacillus sp. YYML68 TaxID=2909250 RepID=UPI002490DD4D|nr:aminotransferase class I/II-fold pyridoxal phosphate-dependent enzyme [Paenibacillus sp. YYML68]